MSAEELITRGNFEFSFYVDDQHIYKEHLNFGAGSAKSKHKYTSLWVPLMGPEKLDAWGRFLWMRFMGKGGQDALTGGQHKLKIEIRPYLQLEKIVSGQLMAVGEIDIQVPVRAVAARDIAIQPIAANSGWEISQATFNEAIIKELNRKIAAQELKDISSVVVIKDGQLLLEEYFNGAKRKTLHNTRSVGKSFAATLLGAAIHKGFLKSEKQKLGEFYGLEEFENFSAAKNEVSLEHLMCMSSGIGGSDFDSESASNEENMYPTKDWVKFALDLPMNETKQVGQQWDYFTAGAVVLGDIIDKSVPGGLEDFAEIALFEPLGIEKTKWQYTPQKVASTAGGLRLRALDLAKYGQLYQNKGQWNGQQLFAKDWVTKSFTRHQELPMEAENYYGYLFWNKTFVVDGVAHEVYYASGNGGNRIFIFKDSPLVVVITATAYNTPYGRLQANKIIQDYILPAVFDKTKTKVKYSK